ncbi:MAG TPA: hypothetical protein VMT95_05310 [Candidatus Binatia bacterium]|nr:hypothetical protein [Candidatus Binatia bacterium]
MEQLVRPTKRVGKRFAWGAGVYLALNFVLLVVEAQWHVLARLTVWDISELKTLTAMLAQLAAHH